MFNRAPYKKQEVQNVSIDHCILAAKSCRQCLKHGGTDIFVHESLAFTNIDLQKFCMEQVIEMCSQNKLTNRHDICNMYLKIADWQFWTFHKRYRQYSKSIQWTKCWDCYMWWYKYKLSWWKLLQMTTTRCFTCYIQFNQYCTICNLEFKWINFIIR